VYLPPPLQHFLWQPTTPRQTTIRTNNDGAAAKAQADAEASAEADTDLRNTLRKVRKGKIALGGWLGQVRLAIKFFLVKMQGLGWDR